MSPVASPIHHTDEDPREQIGRDGELTESNPEDMLLRAEAEADTTVTPAMQAVLDAMDEEKRAAFKELSEDQRAAFLDLLRQQVEQ